MDDFKDNEDGLKRDGNEPTRPQECDAAATCAPEPRFPIQIGMLTKRQMRYLLADAVRTGRVPAELRPHTEYVGGKAVDVRRQFDPARGAEALALEADRWFHEACKFMKANGELGLHTVEQFEKLEEHAADAQKYRDLLEAEKASGEELKRTLGSTELRIDGMGRRIAELEGIITRGKKENARLVAELAKGIANESPAMANLRRELHNAQQSAAEKLGERNRALKEIEDLRRQLDGAHAAVREKDANYLRAANELAEVRKRWHEEQQENADGVVIFKNRIRHLEAEYLRARRLIPLDKLAEYAEQTLPVKAE